MQQIIVIHGGTTYSDYDQYVSDLSTKKLFKERFVYKPTWKELLRQTLGTEYEVLSPSMPNKNNARYSEWKIWFKHFSELADENCILIGHSLGAIFLAKYLSEETFPRTVKATVLIAAPYDDEEGEDLTDFKLEGISDTFKAQAGQTIFYFGFDDPVVIPAESEKYRRQLPDAEFNIVSAPDHFVRGEFRELTDRLKEL
jgi:predicted alpha/beta hydrolase family esterase